jgi:uroporphyrinogen decarboxylase
MHISEYKSALSGLSDNIPVWFMRQAGRYLPSYMKVRASKSIKEICSDPGLISQVSYSPVEEIGVDASIIFYDITLPFEAMGFNLDFMEKIGPVITPKTSSKIGHNYDPDKDRYALEPGIKLFKAWHPDTFLYGFVGGPITLASYIIAGSSDRDLEKTIRFMINEERLFGQLMEQILEMILILCKRQINAGADAVQIFDSWAGSLPYGLFDLYLKKYLQPLSSEISKYAFNVYFSTRTGSYANMLSKTDFDFLSMDSKSLLSDIHATCRFEKGMQGNLDPVYTTLKPEIAISETRRILNDAQVIDRYVFNLGHGVLPTSNVKTLKEIIRMVHNYER